MNENMTSLLTGGIPAAIGAILGYLFGPWDAVIMVLLCVVSLDYITGVIGAAVHKCMDSSVGFAGLFKGRCVCHGTGTLYQLWKMCGRLPGKSCAQHFGR